MRRPHPARFLAALTAVGVVALAVMLMAQVAAYGPQPEESAVARVEDGSRSHLRSDASEPTPTSDPTPEAALTPTPTPTPTLTAAERADLEAGVLDREVPQARTGELTVVSGEQAAPHEAERTIDVRVEVEEGLAIDAETFGEFVMTTLNDPRGWGHDGSVAFARTDGEAEMRVVLGSPDLIDEMCAPLPTVGEYSCGRNGHAALNAVRWARATESFLAEATITDYRHYLVTHEVGHLLGYQHVDCPAAGEVAPVMLQQTISLQGCRPNGWVAP